MTIKIRPEIIYPLLTHIQNEDESHSEKLLKSCIEEDLGRAVTEQDFLGHLDYLNQQNMIQADFSGDAYADKGPNPFPATITLKDAHITPQGESLLEEIETKMKQLKEKAQKSAIAPENMAFLEKVQRGANLPDIFDARDITEVVFRTMRDVMPSGVTKDVAAELHQPASATEETINQEVADLWMDTNPIVSFISKIRQPLNIEADLFLRRIRQEGSLPRNTDLESLMNAIFAATKDELSEEQIERISQNLPNGIKEMWQTAS